jgi:hypothetical protein
MGELDRRHLVIGAPCDPSSTLLVSIVAPTSGHYRYTDSSHLFLQQPLVYKNMMVLPSPSSTQNTHYNTNTAHEIDPNQ